MGNGESKSQEQMILDLQEKVEKLLKINEELCESNKSFLRYAKKEEDASHELREKMNHMIKLLEVKTQQTKTEKTGNNWLGKKLSKAKSITRCNYDEETEIWDCYNHEILSEPIMQFVADRISSDWKRLLRNINIDEYVIENIEEDARYVSVTEKAYQGILAWLRISPQKVTVCLLIDTLECIKRNDVISDIREQFPNHQGSRKVSLPQQKVYVASANHFCGREKEIKIIQDFFSPTQTSKRLLLLLGMPGIGKSELIMDALCQVDRNTIIEPNFYIRGNSVRWTFDDILESILKSWKINIDNHLTGEVNLHEIFHAVDKPVILLLNIAPLRCKSQVIFVLWQFLRNLLRINETTIKIIVSSSLQPQQIVLHDINAEKCLVLNLSEDESTRLLRLINPALTLQQCKTIYKCCGGHPMLLRKISSRTKVFQNTSNEDIGDQIKSISNLKIKFAYLNRLLRDTAWPLYMANVYDILQDSQKVVLAKLSAFVGPIPKSALPYIYSTITKGEIDMVLNEHCILQLTPDGKFYLMSPVDVGYIRKCISKDDDSYLCEDSNKDLPLSEIYHDSVVRVRNFYYQLLADLSRLFYSILTEQCDDASDRLISEYRRCCTVCKETGKCKCNNYNIAMQIFREHKSSILHFLKEEFMTGDEMLLPKINTPCAMVVFLMYMMKKEGWEEFRDMQLSSSVCYEINQIVFLTIQILLNITEGKAVKGSSLNVLNLCIKSLEKEKSISANYQELLLLCYLKRAQIHENELEANKDIQKATKIYSSNFDIIGRMKYHETISDISLRFERYEVAKEHRITQLELTNEQLGNHPVTANTYFALGDLLEITKDFSEAIANYQKAREMFVIVEDNNMQSIVSSALTKLVECNENLMYVYSL